MSLGHKPWANTGKRLCRSDNKIAIISQAVGEFIKKLLSILKGEVDSYVPAENDIKFS